MAKRSWDMLSEEQRHACEQALIDVMGREYDMEIGVIVAGAMLDLVLQTVGGHIYNKGVEDARAFVLRATENLDWDMKELLRS